MAFPIHRFPIMFQAHAATDPVIIAFVEEEIAECPEDDDVCIERMVRRMKDDFDLPKTLSPDGMRALICACLEEKQPEVALADQKPARADYVPPNSVLDKWMKAHMRGVKGDFKAKLVARTRLFNDPGFFFLIDAFVSRSKNYASERLGLVHERVTEAIQDHCETDKISQKMLKSLSKSFMRETVIEAIRRSS